MRTRCLLKNEWGTFRPRTFSGAAARFALSATTLWIGTAPALAQQDIGAESRYGYHTPLDELSLANPEPALTVPRAKKEELPPFFADTRFGAQLKTFYLNRDKFDPSRSEAWALGGSLSYRSGYLADLVRIGAIGYTSQPLYAPMIQGQFTGAAENKGEEHNDEQQRELEISRAPILDRIAFPEHFQTVPHLGPMHRGGSYGGQDDE